MGQHGLRIAVGVVDAFTAVTAVAGGVLLATGREAGRFPAEALRRTPFTDYVVPGWLLATVVGGSAAVATVETVRRPRAGGLASAAAGLLLIGWVVGEQLVLDLPGRAATDRVTDGVYLAAGAAMVGLGTALRRRTAACGTPSRPGAARGRP